MAQLSWVVRLGAALVGRTLRRELAKQPLEEQKRLRDAGYRILVVGGTTLGVGGAVFCATRVEETPLTGRVRLMLTSPEAMEEFADTAYESILQSAVESGTIVNPSDRRYGIVHRVATQLIESLQDADHPARDCGPHTPLMRGALQWGLHVIDDAQQNAFVLPNGKIFVYTGLITLLQEDEDLLASVIGHEMAHALLSHSAEKSGIRSLWLLGESLLIGAVWFFVPSGKIRTVFYES